jgi:hypothetical protein
MNIVKIINYRH